MKKIAAAVVALSFLVALSSALAADMQNPQMQEKMMSSGMLQEMMKNHHHKLMMVYMKNLNNFADALKSEVTATGKVDKDFAANAISGMKQSFEQMQKHKQDMITSMSEDKKQQLADKIKMMGNRHTVIRQHLDSLEKEVNAPNPDAKKVALESEQIIK